eukprot:1186714-Prorocentrum_minimum.AAC.1
MGDRRGGYGYGNAREREQGEPEKINMAFVVQHAFWRWAEERDFRVFRVQIFVLRLRIGGASRIIGNHPKGRTCASIFSVTGIARREIAVALSIGGKRIEHWFCDAADSSSTDFR